jgi:conjugal transfer pilus assembly protein TraL
MNDAVLYRFLTDLDKPKRYLSLTLDELVVAITCFGLLALCNQKMMVAVLGLGLVAALRQLKKGGSPRVLLVLAYWHLPNAVTTFFLPKLPASHLRVWVA